MKLDNDLNNGLHMKPFDPEQSFQENESRQKSGGNQVS